MNNYEKAKEEGIKIADEIWNAGNKLTHNDLDELLLSFAEKIKEGVFRDYEYYIRHSDMCDTWLGKKCDCNLDKLLSDSQTVPFNPNDPDHLKGFTKTIEKIVKGSSDSQTIKE